MIYNGDNNFRVEVGPSSLYTSVALCYNGSLFDVVAFAELDITCCSPEVTATFIMSLFRDSQS